MEDIVKEERKITKYFRKFWHLLWKDDSFKGWIFSIIFLFILIRFIFFPLLSFTTGTSLPLAIVESCSMYHPEDIYPNSNVWWQMHGGKYAQFIINDLDFKTFPFLHGFNKGDILFIVKANPSTLKLGDVIIFNVQGQPAPIIHRIVNITKEGNGSYIFSTMGDNNPGQLSVEKTIDSGQLVGKAILKVAPILGWTKLIFFDWQNPPDQRGFCHEN